VSKVIILPGFYFVNRYYQKIEKIFERLEIVENTRIIRKNIPIRHGRIYDIMKIYFIDASGRHHTWIGR